MEQLTCFLTVAILITLLHLFKIFLMEEKYDLAEILVYYFKATFFINIVMILLVLLIKQYFIWNETLSTGFVINYVVIGSIIGLFLPAFYYKIRHMGEKSKK